MKILCEDHHHLITNGLKLIDTVLVDGNVETVDWTFVHRNEWQEKVPDLDLSQFDVIIPQQWETYMTVRQSDKPKILLSHVVPHPLFAGRSPFEIAFEDKTVSSIVFLTKEQCKRWSLLEGAKQGCKAEVKVVAPGIDVEKFPKWKGGVQAVVCACHNIRRDNDFCGYDLYNMITHDLPVLLFGEGNIGVNGNVGPVGWESLMQTFSTSAVFFNHALHSTLPTVVGEAMAVGIPIVSTRTYFPVSALIEPGQPPKTYGVLSDVALELRLGIKKLIEADSSDEELVQASERNRKKIAEMWDMNAFVENWQSLISRSVTFS